MLVIIDYGVGNLTSIKNMLKKAGTEAVISSRQEDIAKAEKLILPGVGSFDYGMQQLHSSGLVTLLNERVKVNKIPVLGVCLGVQLLTESSQEGKQPGLGWIKGRTVSFDKSKLAREQKIPHMGWSDVKAFDGSKLFTSMHPDPRFYFVHSYHLELDRPEDAMTTANYGYDFVAGVEHGNILGVQFHPEKSHKFGMKLFENFLKYY